MSSKVIENDASDEGVGVAQKGSLREEFEEAEEVKQITDSLQNIYNDQILVELAVERFTFIVDTYQEQPHLMDPHLEAMLSRLLDIARNTQQDTKLSHLAFKLLYLLTKARGPKVVVRLFPHEVVDLEPTLNLIFQQDLSDHETWETRYMLLLWMSMICLIPFDMARLDSNAKLVTGEAREPTMLRILRLGKMYLSVCDKSRDAAALMVSKFLTRQDVKQEQLPDFLDWSLQQIGQIDKETMPGMMFMSGILSTLSLLFKHGKREDLVSYAPTVLERLIAQDLLINNNIQLRKMAVKLIQRLGLTFLKARVASWRYQRGNRSLAENLQMSASATITDALATESKPVLQMDEDEEYDIPEEMEEIIEKLLVGLRDKDTVVRWSAAKGIGRVTVRLPRELGDQVVESVLELFSLGETDGAWHGGCLALAELGRRGLLLPDRLPEVVPVVLKALTYDERRGSCSVGSHVRDAACYVCWSFARAYDPEVIKLHVNQIACSLIIATVFDREINCRRAASAAFQENVGRQGSFPHGIDIVTTADYFAVGNRSNTYLNISVYIAQFEEYTAALIDHLANIKIAHWDSEMREVTSQALHKLTVKAPDYMRTTVLPSLIPLTTGIDMNTRHGSLLATAEVLHALALHAESEDKSIGDVLGPTILEDLKQITRKMQAAKMFKGMTGEMLRPAVCKLIEKIALAKLPYRDDPIIGEWQAILDDNIVNVQRTEEDIQGKAVTALEAFCNEYYKPADGQAVTDIRDEVIDRKLAALKHHDELTRMGSALALGKLPRFMLEGRLSKVLKALFQSAALTPNNIKFAESRRDVCNTIGSVCLTMGISTNGSEDDFITSKNVTSVYSALLEGLKDYTTDSRGDVGAWVREACMASLCKITHLIAKVDTSLLEADICSKMMQNLAQQASEKIDRTRMCAGDAFLNLLHCEEPSIPFIPHKEELRKIFPITDMIDLNWSVPGNCFPKLVKLLRLPAYRYHTLLGITVSVGGLTESLVKHSGQSLMEYLRAHNSIEELQVFTDTMLQIFKDYKKQDRVSLPVMKMIDLLLSSGSFDNFVDNAESPFPEALLQQLKAEIAKSGDAQKLLTSIDLFCSLLQFQGGVRKKCLVQLVIFLCHKYPKVRKTTAEKMYEAFLVYEDVIPEEVQETVGEILAETNWQKPVESIRPIRNQLCDLIGIPKPVLKSKPNVGKADGE